MTWGCQNPELQFDTCIKATVDCSIAVMKKTAKVSSSNDGFKPVLLRKKRRGGALENSSVTESENIGANHLEFAKSLFQHYCQHLRLNHNHILVESAFNFYVNEKIAYLLGTPVNIESTREAFYSKLIQNTNLSTNHNFASIIMKINKKIDHHTQQKYSITYMSKGKGKLQTLAVIPKRIQPPTWKKTRVEFPTNPSYYYKLRSTINIIYTGMTTSNITSTFGRFPFQSKQKKTELLGLYSAYFKEFNSQSSMPSRFRSPPPLPDFGISDLWEVTESEEEEEEEAKNQEFTYQNPIIENPEFKTPNFQTQQNLNPENLEIETLNI
ncbi:hypothetical protein G9A89_019312 [Geosiphon pyriformis]|nr:hypothetical protein G9A89_019312 [Geosiphon pyriformis]